MLDENVILKRGTYGNCDTLQFMEHTKSISNVLKWILGPLWAQTKQMAIMREIV